MKRNKKKLKKTITNIVLYTVCYRNVDKHDDIWIYDSYYIELERSNENVNR